MIPRSNFVSPSEGKGCAKRPILTVRYPIKSFQIDPKPALARPFGDVTGMPAGGDVAPRCGRRWPISNRRLIGPSELDGAPPASDLSRITRINNERCSQVDYAAPRLPVAPSSAGSSGGNINGVSSGRVDGRWVDGRWVDGR